MSNDIHSKTLRQQFTDHKNEQIKRQDDLIKRKEEQIQNIGKKYDVKAREAKEFERAAISHIKKNSHENIEIENKKAQYAISKLRDNHQKTYEHVQKKGEQRITELAGQLEQKKRHYVNEINKLDNYYKSEGQKIHSKHLGELQSRQDYNETMYKKAEDQALRSIELREQDIVRNFIDNPTIPGDSFYQLSGYESELMEDPEFYTLTLKMPEHEQKNVNVVVKQKQITVSAQRAHNKKHEGYGRKVETHNYQSTRDVIALERPVKTDYQHRSYDKQQQMLIIQIRKA